MANYKVLYTFQGGNDSLNPRGAPVLDPNGNIFVAAYGTDSAGFQNPDGAIVELDPNGNLLTTFQVSTYGAFPIGLAPPAQGTGIIYGTATNGISNDDAGLIYQLVPGRGDYLFGDVTQPKAANAGSTIYSGLYVDAAGDIVGATATGAANGSGSLFEIPANSSQVTKVTPFSAGGYGPAQAANFIAYGQNIYGTTLGDQTTAHPGTIFAYDYQSATPSITTVTTLDPTTTGYEPFSGVIADADGNLYGTTQKGGADGFGSIYEYNASSNTLTALAAFTTQSNPYGSLLRDAAGDLWGTTSQGGAHGLGEVFELEAGASTITDVYNFTAGADGYGPVGGLAVDAAGDLYGTASTGGNDTGYGTVFELTDTGFVTCFVSGTSIRTARGDVPVEALAIGDLAVTASGETRPILWIGHRATDCRRHPEATGPVCIAAHAFGAGLPTRDLYLSPGHPVLVGADEDGEGGHLVPIMCLVNGTTVRRVAVDAVTYWHVELDAHDILLAEGLPAESYLDWGDRAFFTEGADHALANPDFVVPGLAGRCRPVALDGQVVEAERRRLDTIFTVRLVSAAAWPNAQNALLALF